MPDHLPGALRINFNDLPQLIIGDALNLVAAIVILIVGFSLAGHVQTALTRLLDRAPNVDAMLKSFFGSIARYLILTLTILSVLAQFGIQTTSLLAVLGAAGLAVGLALQGTLSNVAAGVMLVLFRPFRVGHAVEVGGIAGTVKELSLFTTEVLTGDNVQITVPNSAVWGHPVKNYSVYPERVLSLRFRLAGGADLDTVLAIAGAAATEDPRSLTTPAPGVTLDQDPDGAVALVLAVWTLASNMDGLRTDLIRGVRRRLEAASIPVAATKPLP
jgi:small conductance mechanosensitive channel